MALHVVESTLCCGFDCFRVNLNWGTMSNGFLPIDTQIDPQTEPTQGTAGANVHERLLKYVAEPGGMRGAPGPVSLTVIVHEVVPSFARELLKSIAILRT